MLSVDEQMAHLKETQRFVIEKLPKNWTPSIAIVCGSGLGGLVNCLAPIPGHKSVIALDYHDIPHFPQSTVQGHLGKLVFGVLGNVKVVCRVGRFHYYEGHALHKTAYPIRLFRLLGVGTLIVTNAAGSLNHEKCRVGDIMLIRDHVNFLGLGGTHPLVGPNLDHFGPRFPATSDAYNRNLRLATRQHFDKLVAKPPPKGKTHPELKEGVYAFVSGPSYETPHEARFLKLAGADVVGMSTVPEVLVARHCGIDVLGMSLVTNYVVMPDQQEGEVNYGQVPKATHEEVLQMSHERAEFMQTLVEHVVAETVGADEGEDNIALGRVVITS